ncbi:nuclear transport factor 2 family protein [Shewanella abyssi]|uniref:nuclear transport factor 2 family protein n=1 Tax=Shewanella abyssi TaxID=311789 RepID=UPI00200FAF72|nr:nuclear transport factor 2 family protein [Shewanella abyssi]MCL1051780.1 nuclear transport factor 2 family protein [Shewanella abyssi]
MKRLMIAVFSLLAINSAQAQSSQSEMEQIAQHYFEAMVASQAPNATDKELENYLALLTDDVGHQHLPYQTDDSRAADGKQSMRKGMTFYLGAHTEYKAELLNLFTFNDSAIAIRYRHSAKGIHPQTKQENSYTSIMMEVLEIEDEKVAVIRKYHE